MATDERLIQPSTRKNPNSPPSFRVLTVGDGDLSFSLALARCYNSNVVANPKDDNDDIDNDDSDNDHIRSSQPLHLTASTLVSSEEELCQTYHNSRQVLQELRQRHVEIHFNIDATQLHKTFEGTQWDIVLFQHPHL